jgi:hypothetical protein
MSKQLTTIEIMEEIGAEALAFWDLSQTTYHTYLSVLQMEISVKRYCYGVTHMQQRYIQALEKKQTN